MATKTEQTLETLRMICGQLLEDMMEGDPVKRIHNHVYALAGALSAFISELSEGQHGKHSLGPEATDRPSQAPSEPGGRHSRSITDEVSDEDWKAYAQDMEETGRSDWTVIDPEKVGQYAQDMKEGDWEVSVLTQEDKDGLLQALEQDQGTAYIMGPELPEPDGHWMILGQNILQSTMACLDDVLDDTELYNMLRDRAHLSPQTTELVLRVIREHLEL